MAKIVAYRAKDIEFCKALLPMAMYPMHAPDLSDMIDGAIGEGSAFHIQYGYYAQGIGPETAVSPRNWESRLVKVQNGNTDSRIGWCLDVVDLFMAKMVAYRTKDIEFCTALFRYGHVVLAEALERVHEMPLEGQDMKRLIARIRARAKQAGIG